MAEKFKVVREIETPLSGEEIEYTGPTVRREFIPGVIETVLEIIGDCEKMPDVITLNGTRYILENVAVVGSLDEVIRFEDGVWKRGSS